MLTASASSLTGFYCTFKFKSCLSWTWSTTHFRWEIFDPLTCLCSDWWRHPSVLHAELCTQAQRWLILYPARRLQVMKKKPWVGVGYFFWGGGGILRIETKCSQAGAISCTQCSHLRKRHENSEDSKFVSGFIFRSALTRGKKKKSLVGGLRI